MTNYVRAAALAMLTLTASLATLNAAEARCVVPRFPFNVNQTNEASMSVPKGRRCSINIHAGGRSRFDRISIVTPPRNGTAVTRSIGVGYQPRPGFTGDDAFTFAVNGQFAQGAGTATVRVKVTVQ
jgi:hypothetical protein